MSDIFHKYTRTALLSLPFHLPPLMLKNVQSTKRTILVGISTYLVFFVSKYIQVGTEVFFSPFRP